MADWQTEGDLEIDFGRADTVEKLDQPGRPLPQGMAFADFVVGESASTLMVEIKDPSNPGAGPEQIEEWRRQLTTNGLVCDQLTPKARDSYTYLHLMEQDDKPIDFVFLLGAERLNLGRGELSNLRDRLERQIRQESDRPWARKYIQRCVVVDVEGWRKHFSSYPIRRQSEA